MQASVERHTFSLFLTFFFVSYCDKVFSFPNLQTAKFILADSKDCVADMLELMTGGMINS
jgi:hypothetical protein